MKSNHEVWWEVGDTTTKTCAKMGRVESGEFETWGMVKEGIV